MAGGLRNAFIVPEAETEQKWRRRIVLTPERAAEIYAMKPGLDERGRKVKGKSVPVGQMFNVSAKTIRDIWNQRSWTFATCHLWKLEPTHPYAPSAWLETYYSASPPVTSGAAPPPICEPQDSSDHPSKRCPRSPSWSDDSSFAFLSALHDAAFLSPLPAPPSHEPTMPDSDTAPPSISSPDAEDPFHADWPYWEPPAA